MTEQDVTLWGLIQIDVVDGLLDVVSEYAFIEYGEVTTIGDDLYGAVDRECIAEAGDRQAHICNSIAEVGEWRADSSGALIGPE